MESSLSQNAASPRVSVIMPVYNKQEFLAQAVESVLAQTEKDIELICVDDCSTDGSMELLRRYEKDSAIPFRIIRESENRGLGIARNDGLAQANGTYICFLDSDDYLEPDTLKQAADRADALNADIVIWDIWMHNQQLRRDQHPRMGTLTFGAFARIEDQETTTFCAQDNPDAIFTSFQNWAWNKLFRRSFLEAHDLRFPPLRRMEDVAFTCMALVLAKRIAVVYERFSHYRICTAQSNMDTKSTYPTDIVEAFLLLKRKLESAELYDTYRTSFARWALSRMVYNLDTMHDAEGFTKLFSRLNSSALRLLDINEESLAGYGNAFELEALEKLRANDILEYQFWLAGKLDKFVDNEHAQFDAMEAERNALLPLKSELEQAKQELDEARRERDAARQRYDDVVASAEFRSGRVLCKIPRALQRRMSS